MLLNKVLQLVVAPKARKGGGGGETVVRAGVSCSLGIKAVSLVLLPPFASTPFRHPRFKNSTVGCSVAAVLTAILLNWEFVTQSRTAAQPLLVEQQVPRRTAGSLNSTNKATQRQAHCFPTRLTL